MVMGEKWKKSPLTSFSPANYQKVGIGPQVFLAFNFNPFATPL